MTNDDNEIASTINCKSGNTCGYRYFFTILANLLSTMPL